jgi:hypothetical protein
LDNDFVYESQNVLAAINGKNDFLKYIAEKFALIKETGSLVYAEIGYSNYDNDTSLSLEELYAKGSPSIIMAQNAKENKGALLIFKYNEHGKLLRMDMCTVAPNWTTAKRTNEYPGLVE